MTAFGSVDWREAELQTKRLEQAIQRVLGRIVTGVERAEKIRARHADLGREFLDAHGSNDLGKRDLQRHTFVDCGQQELPGELLASQILRQSDIPVSTSP